MVNNNATHLDESDGHELAAALLREIREHWRSREKGCVTDEEIANLWMAEESSILRRYLQTVGSRNCPALEKGFFAVLTDFIGSSLEGGVPTVQFYEERD